jgi:ssRNA-specific RNase YbeY (16S rRNA maturation enzyme)
LLAIHGTLHLLGYDHDNAEREASMWQQQARALAAAGVAIDVPRFTFEGDPDV